MTSYKGTNQMFNIEYRGNPLSDRQIFVLRHKQKPSYDLESQEQITEAYYHPTSNERVQHL